ncbi:MAG: helix-turn-helix transcriptional regulator [Thermodesulfobacteriota bacterium]
MLEKIFGNVTAEKVLFYLTAYQEGYAGGIARTFGIPLNMVQKQLVRFEEGGLLVSILKGRTRVYTWNPRYPFLKEFKVFVEKAFEFIPEKEKERFYRERRRPRRRGKPL